MVRASETRRSRRRGRTCSRISTGWTRREKRTEFYAHDQHWSNRMILGDSLKVMASLASGRG